MNQKVLSQIISIINSTKTSDAKIQDLICAAHNADGLTSDLFFLTSDLLSQYTILGSDEKPLSSFRFYLIPDEIYSALKELALKSDSILFNSVCNELLWQHYHNLDFALAALDDYWAQMTVPSIDDFFYSQLSLRVCCIYSYIRTSNFSFESFTTHSIDHARIYLDNEGFASAFILKALLLCKESTPDAVSFLLTAIQHFADTQNYLKGIEFAKILAQHYSKAKEKPALQQIYIRIAKFYENAADQLDWSSPFDAMRIINLVHNAMNMWNLAKASNTRSERERLAKRINPIQKLSLQAFQRFSSGPVDLSSFVEFSTKIIEEKSPYQNLIFLLKLIELESISQLQEKQASLSSFMDLTSIQKVDETGKIICIIPPIDDENVEHRMEHLEHFAANYYSLHADMFCSRFLSLLKEICPFTAENLQPIIDRSAFIPEGREKSFLKGLIAGFNLDFVTALSLLMPQVEHAIRHLADLCGIIIYKTDSQGVSEQLSLDTILNSPDFAQLFDEDFLFHLRLFFTSKYGFAMRNKIAHGLCSDNCLNSPDAIAVWCFTLYLCCVYCSDLAPYILPPASTDTVK